MTLPPVLSEAWSLLQQDWVPTTCGAAGMALLAIPALRANRLARAATRLQQIELAENTAPEIKDAQKRLAARRIRQLGEWRRRDELMLLGGYGGLAASYALQLLQ
jgi:hypothetical protein